MKYKLKNLNLGPNPSQRKFTIGPYNIKLKNDYDERQPKLSSLQNTSSSLKVITDELIKEVEKVKKENQGENLVTAIATCYDEPDSILTSSPTATEGIWDLCQILSYLSGHSIFLPSNQRRFHHIKYQQGVVHASEIPKVAECAWKNRTNFKSDQELRPFWLYLNMNKTPEAEIQLLLGCVSLEIIQSIEYNKSLNSVSPQLQKLIDDIKHTINKSGVDEELRNSLKSSVGHWGSSSSSESFKYLLVKYGFITNEIKGLPLKRINSINKLRNGVVHRGKLEYPKWIKDEKVKKKVARFITTKIIRSLIEEYLMRKFKLEEFIWPEVNRKFIQEYIFHGKWDGVKIEIT